MDEFVEAVEVPCFSQLKHLVEAMEVLCRFLQLETAGGSHGSEKGPQTVLTPVGGSNGILAGHKFY
jgi:hypothetical protein